MYSTSRKRYTWREDWQREEDAPDETRMANICVAAMNDVNPNLKFTVETVHGFDNKRLATLDMVCEVINN